MSNIKKKIAVVEDDPFLNKAFLLKLGSAGFNTVSIKDGEEAMDIISKEMPDLILLDLMLPHRSGFEILADLKKDVKLKDIPVLILTNLGQEEERQRGLSMGAKEYLVKTDIKLEEVVEKINGYLKQEVL
ncbi:MAG: PAS/PAC sensor hybrid histidine kinase [Parcubacteria group bacterium GW2011_GWD2_38_12]|nr:MAG: PAS/PAC sensor hybrid histidine kinase [Parcubacteria group bacterium GW2011_GWC2_36_17]KKQ38857.1 MAG: PAS/PAC sensor hybrid histidine kinase [Candidatus Moranbacteria bacterium GW2011_GWF2_37_7]KKQ43668.1 MAG: PAS/PAC sensor hybrid histidine kinase [Parcubacteria group bacterium GW2011_GWE2_37_8]KKQ51389.1 MAG: PAS/PAC sensor hybrid histidine kinase [Parcubacteria group bacterium GW2011_GWD2_38_12]KKQ58443.1 MAG: PAS/PAC sensor hybrid histidine kinase [Parcubacteria group bacterium GW